MLFAESYSTFQILNCSIRGGFPFFPSPSFKFINASNGILSFCESVLLTSSVCLNNLPLYKLLETEREVMDLNYYKNILEKFERQKNQNENAQYVYSSLRSVVIEMEENKELKKEAS